MNPRSPLGRRLLCALGLALASAALSHAQFEINGGAFNRLFTSSPPAAQIPAQPQFAGELADTGGSASVALNGTTPVFPASSHLVLHRSSVGSAFAIGVPRYLLGATIVPPVVKLDGSPAPAGYWRSQPVSAGESFTHLSGLPAVSTPVSVGAGLRFYYSPHANRVFASQAGPVVVTWVTTVPDGNRYLFKEEVFTVSSATNKPVRKIFWTERGFNSPIVTVSGGSIEAINPAYSDNFPARVAQEYVPPGYVAPHASATPPPETRTLWFESTSGLGQLRAYNHEGRILIEYLGRENPDGRGNRHFLGADIVEVSRAAPAVNAVVNLGEQITPRDSLNRRLPLSGSPEWVAAPVLALNPGAQNLYGSLQQPDGRTVYYAERENENPDRIGFYWLEPADAAIPGNPIDGVMPPLPNLHWPQQLNNYTQIWPTNLSTYAHYTVPIAGSTSATGLQFAPRSFPQVVYQDDPAQTQAAFNINTQRLTVSLTNDNQNRTLLKFSSPSSVWYVPLFTKVDDGTDGFVGGDGHPSLSATAHVGDRIEAPSGYSAAGYIVSGNHYLPAAYLDPFPVGANAAEKGAIIPVNTKFNSAGQSEKLRVWWFKRIDPPSGAFDAFYVPAKVAHYSVSYPASPATIVLASNTGSDDLSPAELGGKLYVQNDASAPGFNPNEEHALLLAGRVYALRNDLNVTTHGATYTSEPYALLHYTSATDSRPAVKAFRIDRGTFAPSAIAGTILQPPMPLPLLPPPLDPQGVTLNTEDTNNAPPNTAAPAHYSNFTFADRKGYHWLYRGPHSTGSPTFHMRFYYAMREGFFVPGVPTQPALGALLPYLRDGNGPYVGDAVTGPARAIPYTPTWPATAPELRVAETLTLPKFGLPDVYSQSSAHVLYQQSVAAAASAASVVLHDPIREKVFPLGTIGALLSLPGSILTTSYQGKTYFQRLPPHLQKRFYFDPLRGAKGALVFVGQLVDEVAGEDFIHLNVLSAEELTVLQGLPRVGDPLAALWRTAVNNLATALETFQVDRSKAGAFVRKSSVNVTAQALAHIDDSDTAVADYALTATGTGQGYVSLLFGNGRAFTPEAEPVAVKIIKIVPRLYRGELKTLLSANPLDEQVSLRHTGDFAARPQDYEFEWRYSQPEDGVAPEIYRYTPHAWTSAQWKLVSHPAAPLPTDQEYAAVAAAPLPSSHAINTTLPQGDLPGLVARAETLLSFTGSVPTRVVFSANIAERTGFVLYVNGSPALAHQAPAAFSATPPEPGPGPLQFAVDSNFFSLANNRLEVALFTSADLTAPASNLGFAINYSAVTDQIAALGGSSPWFAPTGTLPNCAIVGGSPSAPLGSPQLVMGDSYFTMRYRPKIGTGNILAPGAVQSAVGWSEWMPPKLVEGWIKRVLAAINPFNQRMRDLYNNAVNTDVSLLTQAGTRWEGDIALTLENINNPGLIAIYETVLNRGKNLSINAGYNNPTVNDALLLAAGYLADLYMIAGNEAFADAANPTISLDDSASATEVNTSRFSFEGQVRNVLDEELALLRGRDDFLSPGITVAPAYNRLYWNYTRGINSGEALYAVNYNIREKAGSTTADGVLDAADAQRMFPQAHGDAYGHYLTALKGYYRLLQNPSFTWTPRSEAVTILGQAVQVDYFDERKFAAAAGGVARTAQQVLALTHRQRYKDDANAGWSHYRDGQVNPSTGTRRDWGLDEWASRSAQGAYINWAVGNALLPDVDNQPSHTGVQIIDRTTVPELAELTILGGEFQTRMDNANARLNPLGLSPGAIAFDISPADLKGGKSHYEQIHERALRSVLNAKGAFDQAGRMTRLLRNQENQIATNNDTIYDQERAFTKQLIDLYGTPYAGDIGPGKTYAQSYSGPDEINWFIVDRPSDLVDTVAPLSVKVRVPTGVRNFTDYGWKPTVVVNTTGAASTPNSINAGLFRIEGYLSGYNGIGIAYDSAPEKTVSFQPNQIPQFADVWSPASGALGSRRVVGAIQQSLRDYHQAQVAVRQAVARFQHQEQLFSRKGALYLELITAFTDSVEEQDSANTKKTALLGSAATAKIASRVMAGIAKGLIDEAGAAAEFPPETLGLSNDTTSVVRGTIKLVGSTTAKYLTIGSGLLEIAEGALTASAQSVQTSADAAIKAFNFNYQQAQVLYEYQEEYRKTVQLIYEIAGTLTQLTRATQRLSNLVAEADRVRAEREIYRQRAAALIQGYRTRDLTFRTFRNEALEQYRSLFDLAGRYTYLASAALPARPLSTVSSPPAPSAISPAACRRPPSARSATPVSPARWHVCRATGPSPRAASVSIIRIRTARSSPFAVSCSASLTTRRAPTTKPSGSRPSSSTSSATSSPIPISPPSAAICATPMAAPFLAS